MQVEISTALAIGAVVFAAGGAWITLASTAKRGAIQGKRIGKLEIQVGEIKGMLRVRRNTLPAGVPVTTSTEEPTGVD